jgi:hypothetical protein
MGVNNLPGTVLISRLHYLISEDHYWNNGVELVFSGSSALVVSDYANKRIRVSVSGSNNTQLMGVIRSHFDHIHETLNMKKDKHVFEEVPCICLECIQSGEKKSCLSLKIEIFTLHRRSAARIIDDVSLHRRFFS